MRTIIVVVFYLLVSAAPALANKVAMVIGNSAYRHVAPLTNPQNDARDVGARLETLGFSVSYLYDADYAGMRRALRDFKDVANNADVAILYYAGHGIEVGRENFLVPADARLASDTDVSFEAVPMSNAVLAVEGARRLSLVIVDACRDNPFAAQMKRANGTRSIGRGLGRIEPAGNTLVAYAAKEGTVAADGDGRNSPYATALIEYLPKQGVEIGLMFRQVRDRVLALTNGQQEPFLYGSISADPFFFVAPGGNVTVEVNPPAAPNGGDRTQIDLVFWQSVKDSKNPGDFEAYLGQFPDGIYAALARNRLAVLSPVVPAKPEQGTPDQSVPSGNAPLGPDEIEASLGLTRTQWREAQASLKALGFDPNGVDGVPGRGTRSALGHWQAARGQTSNGYLTGDLFKRLVNEAAPKIAALKAEQERLARLDPISGSWRGKARYTGNRGKPFSFKARMSKSGDRFSGTMSEPNTFAKANVSRLFSNLRGRVRTDRTISFTKTYDGTGGQTHSIEYRGRLVAAGRIEGTWRVGGTTGTFVMTRQ